MAKPADAKPSKSRKPKASTEASIKAEAVAKAVISRERKIKHAITEVIPEDVTRENAASWRDMLSPFRETALLAAGWVRQFRLKQDRTLTEIADRAEKRRNNAIPLHSVPAKFLIPFVEAASLEEEDSPLVDMWANLLVSASEDYDENMIHFVGLLSRMGARQAKVFAGSLGTGTIDDVERACDTASFTVNERSLRQTMLDSIEKTKAENLDDLVSALLEVLDKEF